MAARTPAGAAGETLDVHMDLFEFDARTLTRPMVVVEDDPRWGDSEVAVYHEDRRHLVSPAAGFCGCPDGYYQQCRFQHLRRVAFALGLREIPTWVALSTVDSLLCERLEEWEGSA